METILLWYSVIMLSLTWIARIFTIDQKIESTSTQRKINLILSIPVIIYLYLQIF